jgi:hypothetical protein
MVRRIVGPLVIAILIVIAMHFLLFLGVPLDGATPTTVDGGVNDDDSLLWMMIAACS